jgi:hypothetical protein
VLVYFLNERGYRPPVRNEVPLPIIYRLGMLAIAAVSLLAGLALFVWPALFPASAGSAVPWWPWSLTPLTARVIGGWYLAAAALQVTLARQRALDTARLGLFSLMVVTTLQLTGALRLANAFDGPVISAALYLLNAMGVFWFSAATLLFGSGRRLPAPAPAR